MKLSSRHALQFSMKCFRIQWIFKYINLQNKFSVFIDICDASATKLNNHRPKGQSGMQNWTENKFFLNNLSMEQFNLFSKRGTVTHICNALFNLLLSVCTFWRLVQYPFVGERSTVRLPVWPQFPEETCLSLYAQAYTVREQATLVTVWNRDKGLVRDKPCVMCKWKMTDGRLCELSTWMCSLLQPVPILYGALP